jgi:hypothetical protein
MSDTQAIACPKTLLKVIRGAKARAVPGYSLCAVWTIPPLRRLWLTSADRAGRLSMNSVLLSFALVGLCIGAETNSASAPKAKEPTCEGKTLGQWRAIAKDENFTARYEAAMALGKSGSAAIPLLRELIKDSDPEVRHFAAMGFGKIGSPAIPTLTELLKDR